MEAASLPWRPLGELFVGRGLITEAELETALAEQAATGKRLGEILVERGLVSGPDLTAALMDQLGVEISKEEGFGSGLWAEIKRRHRRTRPDGTYEDEDGETEPRPILSAAIAEAQQVLGEQELEERPAEEEAEQFEPQPEAEYGFEPSVAEIDQSEFEREFEEIASDYSPPAPIEPEPGPMVEPVVEPFVEIEPEPVLAALPESESEPEPEPEQEPVVAFEPESEPERVSEPEPLPEPEPVVAAVPDPDPVPVPAAHGDDAEDLRAELDAAREDLAHLQEMLADAMTALAALTAEAQGIPYAG